MSTFVGIPRIPTAAPETEMDPQDARGVRMAVSVLLDYPGDDFETKLNAVEEALADLPEPASSALASFVSYARAAGLRTMQTTYVETFDQRRRCALGLTYYTHGDTRGRGQAILAFKEILRRAGFEMEREELPDHLPVVLEFAAFDETGTVGMDLVGGHASPALLRQPRKHRSLAARTRAQVKPALIRSPIQRRMRGDQSGKLRPFILRPRAPIANGGKTRRIARFEQYGARGDGTEGHAGVEDILGLVGKLINAHETRTGHQSDRGHLIVGS